MMQIAFPKPAASSVFNISLFLVLRGLGGEVADEDEPQHCESCRCPQLGGKRQVCHSVEEGSRRKNALGGCSWGSRLRKELMNNDDPRNRCKFAENILWRNSLERKWIPSILNRHCNIFKKSLNWIFQFQNLKKKTFGQSALKMPQNALKAPKNALQTYISLRLPWAAAANPGSGPAQQHQQHPGGGGGAANPFVGFRQIFGAFFGKKCSCSKNGALGCFVHFSGVVRCSFSFKTAPQRRFLGGKCPISSQTNPAQAQPGPKFQAQVQQPPRGP